MSQSIAGIYKIENTKYGLIGADAGGVTKAPVVATTSPTTVGIFNIVPAGDNRYSISMIATNTFLPEQLLTMNDGNKIYGVKQSSTGSSAPVSWYIYEDTAQRGQYVIMSSDYKLWSLSSGKAGTQVQYKDLTAKQLENVKQVVSGKQLFSRHLLGPDSNDTSAEEPNWKFTPATEEPPKPLSPGRYTIKDVKNGAINVECSGNNDAYLNVVSATQAAVVRNIWSTVIFHAVCSSLGSTRSGTSRRLARLAGIWRIRTRGPQTTALGCLPSPATREFKPTRFSSSTIATARCTGPWIATKLALRLVLSLRNQQYTYSENRSLSIMIRRTSILLSASGSSGEPEDSPLSTVLATAALCCAEGTSTVHVV
ncbi:hypothetical protein BKA93DRAFT_805720 [Sparassis latifolia]